MDNLKVLVTKEEEESRIRKLSINGEVFEFFYFDSLKLILDLTTNLLTITPYFDNFVSMGEVLSVELSENEKVNFITMCNYYNNGIISFEELLSSQKVNDKKVNDKKVFTIDKCYSTIGKQLSSFYIDINEELEDEKVINLNFILKKLEEVINH